MSDGEDHMKNMVLMSCLTVGCCLCSSVLRAAALSEDQLEPGDVMLSESVSGAHEFYCLWPGNGRRDDDPLKEPNETVHNSVVNVTRPAVIRNVTCPTVMVMRPEKPNGTAVLVFPGGGYEHLAATKEGSLVGQWLNRQGITAFVVKYRVPKRNGVNVALQDAQRAIRFVRSNAEQFGINPGMVGVMGFSAGGHLCATIIHQFDTAAYPPVNDFDQLDCKPDFGILIYPAYLGTGTNASAEADVVKDSKIPLYIAISQNDKFLPGVESYVSVLKEAKVDYECHIYPDGGHGTGLGGFPWIETCEKWLSSR